MELLALQGSPRIKGNTDLLLDSFLEGISCSTIKSKKIYLIKKRIKPCLGCGKCEKSGKCIIHDDLDDLYPQIAQADILVLSAPIYFYHLPSIVQALIERSQPYWAQRYILKKTPPKKEKHGLFFSLGATQGPKLFKGAQRTVKYFFKSFFIKYRGGLFFKGIEKKGEILQYPSYLTQAHFLGEAIKKGLLPEKWPLHSG